PASIGPNHPKTPQNPPHEKSRLVPPCVYRCVRNAPSQQSILRSLVGFEQQMRILFWVISLARIPPLCCMSTWPDSIVVLQVPHIPWPHEDAGVRPAVHAASRMFSSVLQVTVRPLRTNSTL